MSQEYRLLPNESLILKETIITRSGLMTNYKDELMLTNLNIICINRGMFGNIKNVYTYPLNQIKKYNGKPQAMVGKLSNGSPSLEIYFINGDVENFHFTSYSKKTIDRWIEAINKLTNGEVLDQSIYDDNDSDENSFADSLKKAGEQFVDAGAELLGSFGFKFGNKKEVITNQGNEKINKKCVSCSAPLIGLQGQVIKCKYCDTEQTL